MDLVSPIDQAVVESETGRPGTKGSHEVFSRLSFLVNEPSSIFISRLCYIVLQYINVITECIKCIES